MGAYEWKCPFCFEMKPSLLRQVFGAVNVEVLCQCLSGCVGLSAADEDGVIPFCYHGFTSFCDHAEIAILQIEMNLLGCARREVNALESAERAEWRSRNTRGT